MEIKLALHQLKEARDELQQPLKRRKDVAIQQNDTQYQEVDTTGFFEDKKSKEFVATITDLMEKNNALNEEVKKLKREQEAQSIMLCEISELKKKVEENKVIFEEDKIYWQTKVIRCAETCKYLVGRDQSTDAC